MPEIYRHENECLRLFAERNFRLANLARGELGYVQAVIESGSSDSTKLEMIEHRLAGFLEREESETDDE